MYHLFTESWVELGVRRDIEGSVRLSPEPLKAVNGAMEKLLLEAQRESGATSHVSSPTSSHARLVLWLMVTSNLISWVIPIEWILRNLLELNNFLEVSNAFISS